MPSYKEFAAIARERLKARQGKGDAHKEFVFTAHSQYKMRQYNLSEQKVRTVIRNPKRIEEGIVPKTAAVMQPVSPKKENGKETWKQEIWVMYVRKKSTSAILRQEQTRVISAWRYPGISPKRNPIPDDILQELENEGIL
ncbi:MAG: hypothetical protein AAB519_03525 [Patescibacteria group bacterium]